MKTSLGVAWLLCLPFVGIAQPFPAQRLPGHVPAVTADLQPLSRLPATNLLHLVIILPLRNRDELTSLLQRTYDPASPDYHRYLTPGQFAARFGPGPEDYLAVSNFAAAHGLTVTGTHPNRTMLDVSGTVKDVERTFHVTLRTFQHPTEARTFFAPDVEPSADVAVPLLHIAGLDNFALPRPALRRTLGPVEGSNRNHLAGSGPSGTYMGNDFRAAYVPGATLTGSGQSVALLECDGYYPADITNYESQAGLPNVPLQNVLVGGFNGNPQNSSDVLEVSLDIEMAVCMAPGLSSVLVYEAPSDTPAYIYDLVNQMATDNLAKQISSSWVFSNDSSLDQVFMQYAMQGQSFFEASGDQDAYVSSTFQFNDDPYITLVGGTTLTTSGPGGAWVSETVWNWGVELGSQYDGEGSGGGISTSYAIPAWQQGISMSANGGSTTMRNIPDVALTADNVFVEANGTANAGIGGTSCAAPLWAGFIALVNQQAATGGSPAVGFINPAVYAIGKGPLYSSTFNDITTGNNTWSGSPNQFYAVTGYDLCTGWGTPAGTNLINALAPVDVLHVSPAIGFTSAGGVGGPFTVTYENFTLTNASASTLNWTCTPAASWLGASPASGTLAPGGPASTVTVSLNAAASNLVVGSYVASVWFTNLNDGNGQNRACALDVLARPAITNPPASQAVLEGATAMFTVGATGSAPLSFQWRQNGTNLADGGNVSGSGASALTITDVTPPNVGSYDVVVTNAAGAATSTPAASLTITPSKPVITSQPASQTVGVGTTAQLTVGVVGNTPFTYQWYYDSAVITNATNAVLILSNVTTNQSGAYDVAISNALGSTVSSNAILTVLNEGLVTNGGFELGSFADWTTSGNFAGCLVTSNAPYVHSGVYGAAVGPYGSLGYISQTLTTIAGQQYLFSCWLYCTGQTPNQFTVSWNGTTYINQQNITTTGWINYQFQAAATATGTTLTVGFRDDPDYFGLDDIVVLPTNSAPAIVTQPANAVASVGGSATFSVSATGSAPLGYFWRRNGAPIAGATASSYTAGNVQNSDSGSLFSCLVSNAYGTALSSNATLTVAQPSLVANGGFELGSFTDWTTSGNFRSCSVSSSAPYVHSGAHGAKLGPSSTLGYLSQTLATTAGQKYLVSCWLYCGGQTPNEFSVAWNGTTLFDQHNIGSTGWTNLQFQVSATTAATPLTFGFRNDPSYLGLDDIAVYPVTVTPPQFQGVGFAGGAISFTWSAQAGQSYQVQYCTNLTQTNWINLGGVLSTTNTSITASDSTTASAMRFYRIELLP